MANRQIRIHKLEFIERYTKRKKALYAIKIISIFLLLMQILVCYTCRERATEPTTVSIQLTVEDVAVTEVWLKLTLPAGIAPRTITLKRDTTTFFTNTLHGTDTLIIDEDLLPKHTYKYTAIRQAGSAFIEQASISVTTLYITSHDFKWEIDTLGDGFSHGFSDVAIINDTCVYAVGEIYKRDSTGQFETEHYGLAKWDGRQWKLQKLKVLTPAGFY